MSKAERKQMRVAISMLHRQANQLQDMPSDAAKVKARAILLEAEQMRLILEMDRSTK